MTGHVDELRHVRSLITDGESTSGGVGPTGKPREGISKQTYHVNRGGYRVLWVARPGVGDLVAPST